MNKIILIDDRPQRMEDSLSKNNQVLTELINGAELMVPLESECHEILKSINGGDTVCLNPYDLVIIHQSSLSGIGLNSIEKSCVKNKSNLILFSGNISQVIYFEENDFCKLLLNSNDLYSNRLNEFLTDYVNDNISNLTELIYGKNWKLGIAMSYRQLLIDVENGDDFDNIPHKKKQLENCINTIGKHDHDELNLLIEQLLINF